MVAAIKQPDRRRLEDVCQRHHVRQLSLFGSFARGEGSTDSDIDMLVEYEPGQPVTYLDLVDLSDELRDLFGGEHDVDLVTQPALHELIRNRVMRERVVLYER